MTDFIDQLESELLCAARRRQPATARAAAGSRTGRVLSDLRAMATGALLTASVSAVAAVVVVVLLAGHGAARRGAARLGAAAGGGRSADVTPASGARSVTPCDPVAHPALTDAAPRSAVRTLLTGDTTANHAQTVAAVDRLDASWVVVRKVYTRYVRVVRFASGLRVVVVPVQACLPAGDGPSRVRTLLLAEIQGARSGSATVDLGTVNGIHRGDAFSAAPQAIAPVSVKVDGRWRSLALAGDGPVRDRARPLSRQRARRILVELRARPPRPLQLLGHLPLLPSHGADGPRTPHRDRSAATERSGVSDGLPRRTEGAGARAPA